MEWSEGLHVGEYALIRQLGSGGMGVVWEAQHREGGYRRAIKSLAGWDLHLKERFLREGEALARVGSHPNVVGVHAAGCSAGRLYLVMDLHAGGDLGRRLEEGPLAPDEAVNLIVQVAEGLAHVHGQGVLHRDVKPKNVIFDERGTPLLVDFGLARLKGAEALTTTGEVLGTPGYMAPEQAGGETSEIGIETDVYGLGALLFTCLTARPPFSGGGALATLARVIREPAPRPGSLVAGVPTALDAVCARALSKRPGDRYPGPRELGAAALAAVEQEPRGAVNASVMLAVMGALGIALLAALASAGGSSPEVSGGSPSPGGVPVEVSPAPTPASTLAETQAIAEAPRLERDLLRHDERRDLDTTPFLEGILRWAYVPPELDLALEACAVIEMGKRWIRQPVEGRRDKARGHELLEQVVAWGWLEAAWVLCEFAQQESDWGRLVSECRRLCGLIEQERARLKATPALDALLRSEDRTVKFGRAAGLEGALASLERLEGRARGKWGWACLGLGQREEAFARLDDPLCLEQTEGILFFAAVVFSEETPAPRALELELRVLRLLEAGAQRTDWRQGLREDCVNGLRHLAQRLAVPGSARRRWPDHPESRALLADLLERFRVPLEPKVLVELRGN